MTARRLRDDDRATALRWARRYRGAPIAVLPCDLNGLAVALRAPPSLSHESATSEASQLIGSGEAERVERGTSGVVLRERLIRAAC